MKYTKGKIKNMYEYKGLYKLEKNFDNILNSNKIDNFYNHQKIQLNS